MSADNELEQLRAEVERLRAELAESDTALNEALNHNDDNCEVVAERDVLKAKVAEYERMVSLQASWSLRDVR